jgi:GWxTD domain-containing protein
MRIISLVAFTLIVMTLPALAQRGERITSRPGESRDYLGASGLWSPDVSKGRIDVFLRISKAVLVTIRSNEPDAPSPFRRLGELTVELLDSSGTVQAREIERVEIPEPETDSPLPLEGWIEQRFTFGVPPGRYTVRAEMADLQSKNRFTKTCPAHTLPPRSDVLLLSPAFFYTAHTARTVPDTLVPQTFGTGVQFSSAGGLLLEVLGADSTVQSVTIAYRLLIEERDEKGAPAWRADSISGVPLQRHVTLEQTPPLGYVLKQSTPTPDRAVALLPLPLEQLPLRRFKLEVTIHAGARQSSASIPFATIWPEQPESLRDVEYALESLRFIVTDHILDSLTRGDFETRRNNLENFWKPRDATPETADNPLMTEYYRRVDYARQQFTTLKQRDGTRTDRGKIYVLYGPPTRSERSLDPSSGFTETWTYGHLRKKFLFQDQVRDGSYVLISTLPE